VTARPSPADLLQPALALRIACPRDQAPDGGRVQLVDGRGAHRRTCRRGHKTDTLASERADTRDNRKSSRSARGASERVPLMTACHQAYQARRSATRTSSCRWSCGRRRCRPERLRQRDRRGPPVLRSRRGRHLHGQRRHGGDRARHGRVSFAGGATRRRTHAACGGRTTGSDCRRQGIALTAAVCASPTAVSSATAAR
jgi:hypothetical protein